MSKGQRIYLIGFMGSGKTTVGIKLASLLSWSFLDLDKVIQEKTGKDILDIFSQNGESYFREIEAQVLRDTGNIDNLVVSTGGGAPCFSGNMEFMNLNGVTIYLKLTPDQLESRLVNEKSGRPLIKDLDRIELYGFIGKKLSEREEFYSKARIIADGFNLDMDKLLENLRREIY